MWTIRFILLGLLMAFLISSSYFLSRRQKYQEFLENRIFNLALVFLYNLLCYLLTGLPSEPHVFSPLNFFSHPTLPQGFFIIGLSIIVAAVCLMGMAVRQRKTLGAQNVKEGLLVSGVYRYFRHPLYAGVILASLGVALVTSSRDGLLMVPMVFLINTAQALIEERFDIGRRFSLQYQEYRKRTGMFGPLWAWIILVGGLLVTAGISRLG